jgi:hypothetical protein
MNKKGKNKYFTPPQILQWKEVYRLGMHKEDENSPSNIMRSKQSNIIDILKEEFAKNWYLI